MIVKENSVYFATRNKNKVAEFARILGKDVTGVDLSVIEIQGTPEEVLEQKARDAWSAKGEVPIYVEDSAFICHGMDDLPGVYAHQFLHTPDLRDGFLRWIEGNDRSTTFQVGIAIFDGNRVHSWIGKTTGEVATMRRGKNGFDFDDIFIPDGQVTDSGEPVPYEEQKTNAEMTPEEKDRYSPRRKALELLSKQTIQD